MDRNESKIYDNRQKEKISGVINKQYSCDKCSNLFNTKSDLTEHLKVHTLLKKKQCNVCGTMFHSKDDVKQHMKTHISDISFPCKYCEQKFKDNNELVYHTQTHHKKKTTVDPTQLAQKRLIADLLL